MAERLNLQTVFVVIGDGHQDESVIFTDTISNGVLWSVLSILFAKTGDQRIAQLLD